MKTNEIQNKDEEDMKGFRFIEIDPLHEHIEIFNITAGSEEDAFELANEDSNNFSSCFLLTDKMVFKLYDEIVLLPLRDFIV